MYSYLLWVVMLVVARTCIKGRYRVWFCFVVRDHVTILDNESKVGDIEGFTCCVL